MTDAVRDRIVVAADPDTIMDVIGDFEAYPEWQPEVRGVEVLETDDDGWGTRVRFTVDAKVALATYVLDYTYRDTEMRWTLVEGDKLRRNDGAYTLHDRGDGTTEVHYELELEPTVSVPGLIRRQVAKRIADTALKGMKRRVESRA
ncbi:MAG: SRPBCC family protein [Actinomycetota bacterium]|nr:SRPBCC family protein [Actinomycetota bacterium]